MLSRLYPFGAVVLGLLVTTGEAPPTREPPDKSGLAWELPLSCAEHSLARPQLLAHWVLRTYLLMMGHQEMQS